MVALLRRLRVAAAMITVCVLGPRSAVVSGQPPVPPTRFEHPEVLYGVDEESDVGTKVGRGLKLDAGLVEKYPPEVLKSVSFRFLSRVPNFVAVSPNGHLEIIGRVDREMICSADAPVGSRDNGGLCQVRLDVAVQPMKYFDIIKACIANYISHPYTVLISEFLTTCNCQKIK